jgi:hypothetical protein
MQKQIVGILWWPHSGGRWLSRTLLGKHSNVFETAFTHPWLYLSTDMLMELDNTAQVHKARSLPELKYHLIALTESINYGREKGLQTYFDHINNNYVNENSTVTHIVGEMCMGSPIPRSIDMELLFKVAPEFRLVHLIRNPIDCFPSFATRYELDSDPVKIAGSWLTLNSNIRIFFENNPQFKNQYLPVRYEDLVKNTHDALNRICDFLGLEFEKEMLETVEQRWGRNTKGKCTDLQKDIMISIAANEMSKYDYI